MLRAHLFQHFCGIDISTDGKRSGKSKIFGSIAGAIHIKQAVFRPDASLVPAPLIHGQRAFATKTGKIA